MTYEPPYSTASARLVGPVILTTRGVGAGTTEDIFRIVYELWTTDGLFISRYDPYPNGSSLQNPIEIPPGLIALEEANGHASV